MILRPIDYACLGIYFLFVLAIGWMVRRRIHTSEDFLTSGHSVPVWIPQEAGISWYKRPVPLAIVVGVILIIMNVFVVLGAILLIYGLASPGVRPPLDSGVNVNLWTGLVLLVFGGCLFCLSLRTKL